MQYDLLHSMYYNLYGMHGVMHGKLSRDLYVYLLCFLLDHVCRLNVFLIEI